jgi:hypothetical protein
VETVLEISIFVDKGNAWRGSAKLCVGSGMVILCLLYKIRSHVKNKRIEWPHIRGE